MPPDLPAPTYAYAKWRIEFLRQRVTVLLAEGNFRLAAALEAEADQMAAKLRRQIAALN